MSEDMKEWLIAKMSKDKGFRMEVEEKVRIAVEEKIIGLFMKKIINEISRDQLLRQLRDSSIEDPNFECLALMVNEEELMSKYDDFIKEKLRDVNKDKKALLEAIEELSEMTLEEKIFAFSNCVLNKPVTPETVEQMNKVKQLVEGDDFVPLTLKDVEEAKEHFVKLVNSKCRN